MGLDHTPTPFSWSADGNIVDANGITFAQIYGERPQRIERAGLIVQACNSHADLVAACRLVAGEIESGYTANPSAKAERCRFALAQVLNGAIAKATPASQESHPAGD